VTCTATDPSGAPSTVTFNVIVRDTQPPVFTSLQNLTVLTTRTGDSGVAVNYTPPAASDNCGTATVVCTPAPGSVFPRGTTTVTCTATDGAGNQSTSRFQVTVFDACVQDNGTPTNSLLWNSATGQYRFCCNGTRYEGRGTVKRGGTYTLDYGQPDRRVSGKIDLQKKTGTGFLEVPRGKRLCTLTDSRTTDDSCNCQ
jgi:hypothetical protein